MVKINGGRSGAANGLQAYSAGTYSMKPHDLPLMTSFFNFSPSLNLAFNHPFLQSIPSLFCGPLTQTISSGDYSFQILYIIVEAMNAELIAPCGAGHIAVLPPGDISFPTKRI